MNIQQILSSWNSFWFKPQSPIPVAAFRIALGLIVLYLCFLVWPNRNILYSDTGLLSLQTMNLWWSNTPQFSLFQFMADSPQNIEHVFTLLAIAGLCLTFGLFSRLSAFSIFIVLLSLDSRNHFVFHPAFALLRVMALYLSLSHCGAALSVDKLLCKWTNPTKSHSTSGSPWAQRLMQLQIVAVYWSALTYQINGTAWLDGSAVYYATHLTEFQRFQIPGLFDNMAVCQIIGFTTMLFELAFCTLIWIKECRYIVLGLGIILHLGIECSLVFIPLLQPLMLASYLLFIYPEDLLKLRDMFKNARSH